MRRMTTALLLLLPLGALLFLVSQTRSQSTNNQSQRENRPQNDRPGERGPQGRQFDGPGERGPQGRQFGGGRGPGGFRSIPPLILALDKNRDGEISADELNAAPAALRSLDKNKDGQLTEPELRPDFGPGGPPFGRGRGGPGGFGGPGGGFGGPRGPGGFGGGDSNAERVNPEKIKFNDGAATIPNHDTFHKLSYRGGEVLIDTFLSGLEFVKFTLADASTDKRQLYFINTKTHRAHMMFARVAGLPRRGGDTMKGVLVYRPMLKSPSGSPGLYTFEFEPFDAYEYAMVKTCHDMLIKKMPNLKGNIGYYPRGPRAIARYEEDKKLYDRANVKVYLDSDLINTDVAYLPLNRGATFGRLTLMTIDQRPTSRDVVIYNTLPNELPRVAGIITAVRQTPLSHVNLRAIQDRVPNAFITNAAENGKIKPLIGKYVAYKVTADGYDIRGATRNEVEAHFAKLRPAKKQVPQRNLAVTKIRPLDQVTFQDSASVGVKAANLATLRSFEFPSETVPNGSTIPFYFYDEFMKYNGFYKYAKMLLANSKFQQDRDTQVAQLKKLRKLIKQAKMPNWMMQSLHKLHMSFPKGTSLRCRSSTNNEDLPGFSGAGLYDSYTHHPKEGHFSKSIKQVYASLWNFRAFEEREFFRVDHFAAAMGVLVHPNYKGELANGVAVTHDILYQTEGNYYINTQVGEDLVTNPEKESVPEEGLLDWWKSSDYDMMRSSNRAKNANSLLSDEHLEQLRDHLGTIHAKFARLYGKSLQQEGFAMEIEFKITRSNKLVIKQARPWVFSESVPTQITSRESND